jgi:hypothetical protein
VFLSQAGIALENAFLQRKLAVRGDTEGSALPSASPRAARFGA